MTTLRNELAEEANEAARVIRVRLDQAPSIHSEAALRVVAQLLEARALALRGPEPVDVPFPGDPDRMVRTYSDGRVEVLP